VTPVLALSLALVLTGCTPDALYTYCTADAQCGSRTYDLGDDREIEVFLVCIEATVEVAPGDTTVGNLCTLDCRDDAECDSFIGLADGACVRWSGDALAYCYQRCVDQSDCYPSSRCADVQRDGRPLRVCVPTRT
jgi:hypothetical protein